MHTCIHAQPEHTLMLLEFQQLALAPLAQQAIGVQLLQCNQDNAHLVLFHLLQTLLFQQIALLAQMVKSVQSMGNKQKDQLVLKVSYAQKTRCTLNNSLVLLVLTATAPV